MADKETSQRRPTWKLRCISLTYYVVDHIGKIVGQGTKEQAIYEAKQSAIRRGLKPEIVTG